MTTIKNTENLRQYKNRFYLIVEKVLPLRQALICKENSGMHIQFLSELHDNVLCYK